MDDSFKEKRKPKGEITYIYLVENCYGDPKKVYIGKTVDSRFSSHKKKFGQNIIYNRIDQINSWDKKDWKPLETYWIYQFRQWGFDVQNDNDGGGGPPKNRKLRPKDDIWKLNLSKSHKGKKLSKETKQKMSLAKLDKPSSFLGKHHSNQTKEHLRTKKSIPIYQYDLQGNFLKKWNSTKEASTSLNINESSINGCILKKNHFKTAGGYLWDKDLKIIESSLINGNSIKIQKIDKITNKIICIYNSLNEASFKDNVSKNKIIASCKNRKNTYGRYKYSYFC